MKVYSMNVTAIDANDEKWYKYLSEKRAEKVSRIKHPLKRAQSIGAELLLRRAVGDITGAYENVLWDTDEYGKLYLTEYPDIHVNLSHSGNWAVCAVSDTPVGIDIQKYRDFDEGLVTRYFSADETEYVKGSSDKKNAFFTVWTKKESLLKAVGVGLRVALKDFTVLGDMIDYDGDLYKFKEYTVGDADYKCFVCFASSQE